MSKAIVVGVDGSDTSHAALRWAAEEARHFEHVDHAFTCSRFLTDVYRDRVGLISTPLEPPIDWSTVVAPEESRAFVTFGADEDDQVGV